MNPQAARPGVRPATGDEWRPLGALLGRAFSDDDLWSWLCPDDRRRRAHLGQLFAQLIRRRVADGTTWTDDLLAGAAVWAPPGAWRTRPSEQTRMAIPLLRAVGAPLVLSRLSALARLEKLHPDEPHWYLEVLGAEPTLRGTGVGSALMTPVLERCDSDGVGAYLESSKQQNLAFYARFGFEVLDEVRLHPDGPPVWPMWRRPR